MPFGKHKGADISVIPVSYLSWAVRIVKDEKLKDAIQDELYRRGPVYPVGAIYEDESIYDDPGSFMFDDFDPFDPF